MKTTITVNDKHKAIIYLVILVVGLLMTAALIEPYFKNPPQCPFFESSADVGYKCSEVPGSALYWLLGLPLAIVGTLGLVWTLFHARINATRTKNSKTV